MRTSNKSVSSFFFRLLPHYRIRFINAFQLCIINYIFLVVFAKKTFSKLDGFRCKLVYVIKSNRTVRSCSRTKIFKVCFGFVIQLCANPLVQANNVRNIFHNLKSNCRTKNLSDWFFTCIYRNLPLCFSSFISK